MPHVALLRKFPIPLMGKNPLSFEITPGLARSCSQSPLPGGARATFAPYAGVPSTTASVCHRTPYKPLPDAHTPRLAPHTAAPAPRAASLRVSAQLRLRPVRSLSGATAQGGCALGGPDQVACAPRRILAASHSRQARFRPHQQRHTPGGVRAPAAFFRRPTPHLGIPVGAFAPHASAQDSVTPLRARAPGDIRIGSPAHRQEPLWAAFIPGVGFALVGPAARPGRYCASLEGV